MKRAVAPMPIRYGALFATLALLSSPAMAAGMYSWVDANGVKHYSDQPPPPKVKDAKKLKMSGNSGPLAEPPEASQPTPPAAGQAMARAAGYEDQDIKRNCEIATKNLSALTSAAPLPEGSEGAVTRQQSIDKTQGQVKLFCQ